MEATHRIRGTETPTTRAASRATGTAASSTGENQTHGRIRGRACFWRSVAERSHRPRAIIVVVPFPLRRSVLTAFAALGALAVCTAPVSASTAALPSLYVSYNSQCHFTMALDSGAAVATGSAIPYGEYQLIISTPVPAFSPVASAVRLRQLQLDRARRQLFDGTRRGRRDRGFHDPELRRRLELRRHGQHCPTRNDDNLQHVEHARLRLVGPVVALLEHHRRTRSRRAMTRRRRRRATRS